MNTSTLTVVAACHSRSTKFCHRLDAWASFAQLLIRRPASATKEKQRRTIVEFANVLLVWALLGWCGPSGVANGMTAIVPLGYELESVEGDTISDAANYTGPFRGQELFLANNFSSQELANRQITGLAFRPDVSISTPYSVSWLKTKWIFSTTKSGSLSDNFTENYGDDMTVVYSGDLFMSTSSGGGDVGPRPFDYGFQFQRPFRYDPADGNLVIEIQAPMGYDPPLRDDEQTMSEVGVIANLDLSDVASFRSYKSWILALTYSDIGDFDADDQVSVTDIDALSSRIRSEQYDARFDLNNDELLDETDRVVWVKELKKTWFGDSDLDGEFNSSDLVSVFAYGQYEDAVVGNSSWATGDWNGDGEFNSSDLVLAFQDGGYELGKRGAAGIVPEPASGWSLVWSGMLITLAKRRTRSFPS